MCWLTDRNRGQARSYKSNSMNRTPQNSAVCALKPCLQKQPSHPFPVHFLPFVPFQPQNLTKRDNSLSTPDMRRKADWKSHLSS
jgi:hypothetical protein